MLTRACEQDPACEEAQVWRGDLAMVVGRPDVALEAYRQAVKLAPKNARYAELLQVATKAARR